jgi:broad specificity phosphatase PhoE
VVVVAHAGTDAVCLGHLLGIDPVPWEWERFVSFHTSVSIVRPMPVADAHSFSLFRFSDTSHLPPHLHTV